MMTCGVVKADVARGDGGGEADVGAVFGVRFPEEENNI